MDYLKFLRTLFFFVLLAGGIFLLGCSSEEGPPAEQKDPSPVAQTVAVAEGSDPVEGETRVEAEEEGATPPAQQDGPVVILVAGRITTLDPYKMVRTHPDESVARHLWDTLTRLDDDLQVASHLAESWRLVNNFTWEFKLRQDIVFHNNEPVDAEAVRFSIERAQTMPGSLETFAADVVLEEVEVVDDHTVRLTTRQPVVNLPYHLAFLEILPPMYYSQTPPNRLAFAPVGSGPYQLVDEWTSGEPVVLDAAPAYWQGQAAVPRLEFETVPLANDRLTALRLNSADLVTDLPPIAAEEWNIPDSRLESIVSTRQMFVGINIQEDTPLADKRVRQALNYGVNVEQIIDNLLEGYGQPYGSWVYSPAESLDLEPWPYDPDLAQELLAEAGYSEGFTVTLRAPDGAYYHDAEISNAIAQQLEQIGVTVNVETESIWDIYVHDLLTGNIEGSLFLLALNSRGNTLEEIKNLSSAFEFNPTQWQNESFEETLDRAIVTFNEEARTALLNEAQIIAYEESPWIWLWKPYDFYGVNSNLDWTPRPDGLVYLYRPATPEVGDNN